MINHLTPHHVGYTVADMEATIQQFAAFGYQAGPVLHDEALQVDICYLTREGEVTIELIHQYNPESLETQLLLANGVMPYHLAYEAEDFERACSDIEAMGYRRLFDPVPVKALGGIHICYYHHPAIGYIEILSASR